MKTQLAPSEGRFYIPGLGRRLFEIEGLKFGISICHGGWRNPETVRRAAVRGAKIGGIMRETRLQPGLVAFATALLLILATSGGEAGSPARSNASGLAGHWVGEWVRDGSRLPVWIDFAQSDSGYTGSFGSDALRVLDIPFRSVTLDSTGVHWLIPGDTTTPRFDGSLAGGRIVGTFQDGTASGTFDLRRAGKAAPAPYKAEEVRFRNGAVTLAGTLLMPAGTDPHPAIVFVHGSGGEGRYASRFLADRFARAGFAALIYDKRGVGASGGDWRRATFQDLAGDAVAAIEMLAGDPRIRPDAIGIHGHSQGGTLAPLIASQAPLLGFVIASAASGVSPAESERYSYYNFLGVPRMRGEDSLRAVRYADAIVRIAYEGEPWSRADSVARTNSGAKWFMGIPDSSDAFWWLAPRTAAYRPAAYWRSVKAPVLLLYGAKDERVPVEESLHNIKAALRAGGNADVTSKVFPNCDHTFRVSGSSDGRFHWPRTPDGYLETLIGWAQSKTGRR